MGGPPGAPPGPGLPAPETVLSWRLLAAALVLDLAVGDPDFAWHPVRLMGAWIRMLEDWARASAGSLALRGCGVALLNVGGFWLMGWLLLRSAAWADGSLGWGPWLRRGMEGAMLWSCLGVRSMVSHALEVLRPLEQGDVAAARRAVARIVGRDTVDLDAAGICRACLESVAESLGDGVVAPLFFAALAGAPAALAYRAANTADSMIGHRDTRYAELGWASARLDDLLNWIPARLAALCAALAALPLGLAPGRALRTAWNDGPGQPSPNSGWPEGAFAGALGVQLGGPCRYRGDVTIKAFLGPPLHPVDAAAGRRALALFLAATAVCLALLAGVAQLAQFLPPPL
ncbi:MAG TPA: adenosylcobinamide-phosphate synthase CbiB [bacterium]|nr:adenosylcobinamide-phosphate synthase CbiB [bacterium]